MTGFWTSIWQRLARRGESESLRIAKDAGARTVWIRDCTEAAGSELEEEVHPSERIEAVVESITQSEIYLQVGRQYEKGSLLSVELPRIGENEADHVLAYVLRSWPRGQAWALTCIFSNELSEEDLRSFGAFRSKSVPPTRRSWTRFPCDRPASYHFLNAPDPKQLPARTVDISPTGIGLLVDQAIETGTVLTLELKGKAGRPGRVVLACVVRSGPVPEHRWHLGCNFIRHLEDKELEALL
jgi:PilZ domain-containing protein